MPALKEESVPDWIIDAGSAFHIRTVAGKKVYLWTSVRAYGTWYIWSWPDLLYDDWTGI